MIVLDANSMKPHKGTKGFFSHQGKITSAEFSPDGQFLVTSGQDRRIYVYSLDSMKMCKSFVVPFEAIPKPITCAKFLEDNTILTLCEDGLVRAFQPPSEMSTK